MSTVTNSAPQTQTKPVSPLKVALAVLTGEVGRIPVIR